MRTRNGGRAIVCQNQSDTPERYALCGLYAINNCMQIFDFLTIQDMSDILATLAKTKERRWNHGDVLYGGYSINALQLALRFRGYNLVSLVRPGREMQGPRSLLFERVNSSKRQRLVLIGLPPGQVDSVRHAVSRVKVNDKFYLINPDDYGYVKCTQEALRCLFARIEKVYCIEKRETE